MKNENLHNIKWEKNKVINLYLTYGFDGDKVNILGSFESEEELNLKISEFKKNTHGKYSITPYETVSFLDNGRVIDFGDHSYFLKVEVK